MARKTRAPAFRIDMIGADNSRLPLGVVPAQAVRASDVANDTGGIAMTVAGELLPLPGADPLRLSHPASHRRPVELEISDDAQTFRGIFRITAFDPLSHHAVLWSSGTIQASPA